MLASNINNGFGPSDSFIEEFFTDGRVVVDDIKGNKVIRRFVFDVFEPVDYRLGISPLIYFRG
jgi:hypothetical protein